MHESHSPQTVAVMYHVLFCSIKEECQVDFLKRVLFNLHVFAVVFTVIISIVCQAVIMFQAASFVCRSII